MEKSPLRGSLAKKSEIPEEKPKLRGTLANSPQAEGVERDSPLRGTLAPHIEAEKTEAAPEGRVLSEAEVPDVKSLENFMGHTFFSRDSGKKAVLARISKSTVGTNPPITVGLHREDGARISLTRERFREIITTEGAGWRYLG